jgi:hypothetical protein
MWERPEIRKLVSVSSAKDRLGIETLSIYKKVVLTGLAESIFLKKRITADSLEFCDGGEHRSWILNVV